MPQLIAKNIPLVLNMFPNTLPKTFGFLMFSGGIERDQWYEMGY